MKYPKLFAPMQVGTLTFRNRLLSGPNMMCALNPDGSPTDYMVGYYEEKAKGGVAQVTVGDTPVEERGFTTPRHPILSQKTVQKWSEVARAITQHGAVASIELNHGGRISNTAVTGFQTVGPIDEVKLNGTHVKGAAKEDLEEIAKAYGEAAKVAVQAGFQMVMLHGAHGWLLDQMLSPKFNTRTDEFGGSLENRAKFPLMVIDAVRKDVGPKVPIEYRIGPELAEGGLGMDELVKFCLMIEDKVQLIHVSAGLDTDPNFAVKTHPTMFLPHMPNVKYAAEVKKHVTKCPVVTVGSVVTPAEAEKVLEEGKADAVAMVRSLIADPFLPQKAREGHDEDIRPCLRCLDCLTGMQTKTRFACAVNPRTGHEARLNAQEAAAPKRRKTVLIAGGGPGGLEAAATAAARGHKVILAEQSDSLGGLLRFTDYDSLKADLKRLKDHLIYRVEHSDVEVRLNTEVTPELVAEIQPDALFLALGSTPVVFPLPGIETAQHATTAYTNLDALGKTVAVMGGGLVGCETALFLAETGRDVTIIEMQDSVAPDANWMHRVGMLQSFSQQKNLHVKTGLRCMAVTDAGVETQDKDGNRVMIPAESKVYAFGQRAAAVDKLMALDVPVIRIIGDCHQVGKTNGAIFDGYHAAMDL
ncbi:MAG: FAD-dependent oxidoreductase [Oscillospiraceae bacterium]|nr:FAD-dependent oxidoreductase [Oscillospiraceae bacterium]